MIYQTQFEDLIVQEFEECYREAVEQFELSERQQIYSSLPKDVLDEALEDPHRVANIARNQEGKLSLSSCYMNIINMKVMIRQTTWCMCVRYR